MKQPPGGRTQQRLADLHRAISAAVQGLHQHQLVVVTALRGDDETMQQAVLEEHQSRVAAAMQEIASLSAFVDRLRTTNHRQADDIEKAILRAG
jgi:hypothetical protein